MPYSLPSPDEDTFTIVWGRPWVPGPIHTVDRRLAIRVEETLLSTNQTQFKRRMIKFSWYLWSISQLVIWNIQPNPKGVLSKLSVSSELCTINFIRHASDSQRTRSDYSEETTVLWSRQPVRMTSKLSWKNCWECSTYNESAWVINHKKWQQIMKKHGDFIFLYASLSWSTLSASPLPCLTDTSFRPKRTI